MVYSGADLTSKLGKRPLRPPPGESGGPIWYWRKMFGKRSTVYLCYGEHQMFTQFLSGAEFCKLANPLIDASWDHKDLKWVIAFRALFARILRCIVLFDLLRTDILTSEKKVSCFVSWFYLSWCFKMSRLCAFPMCAGVNCRALV